MAVASGQNGKIQIGSSTLIECTGWTFNMEVNTFRYATCQSSGSKKTIAGTKQGNGTLTGLYDPDDIVENLVGPGDSVTLKLYLDADDFYSVPAIIKSVNVEVDIDNGDALKWTVEFETNGAWTEPT